MKALLLSALIIILAFFGIPPKKKIPQYNAVFVADCTDTTKLNRQLVVIDSLVSIREQSRAKRLAPINRKRGVKRL